MISMTGYGRGESKTTTPRCVVECSSVNRKGLEVACQMPRDLAAIEVKIRDLVQRRIARGRVAVVIQFPANPATPDSAPPETTALQPPPTIDTPLARNLLTQLRALQTDLDLPGTLDINTLLAIPGILRPPEPAAEITETPDVWPSLQQALESALTALVAMRRQEGEALATDLTTRLAHLATLRDQMAAHAQQVVTDYRALLHKRLAEAALEFPVDEHRLATEIAIFAERCDVSEELTRLASHFDQFREKLASPEPIGRALEFLTQEISREFNTLGAKAGDSALSRLVVDAKVELDKMREQILNVE